MPPRNDLTCSCEGYIYTCMRVCFFFFSPHCYKNTCVCLCTFVFASAKECSIFLSVVVLIQFVDICCYLGHREISLMSLMWKECE